MGSSGGILLGVNDDKYQVLNHWIKDFSISVLLKNRFDSFEWIFSVVYGPTISSLRAPFLQELRDIETLGATAFLICGDFNMIRRRSEKIGRTYDHVVSRRFNECISDLQLLDLPLQDRNFT